MNYSVKFKEALPTGFFRNRGRSGLTREVQRRVNAEAC